MWRDGDASLQVLEGCLFFMSRIGVVVQGEKTREQLLLVLPLQKNIEESIFGLAGKL